MDKKKTALVIGTGAGGGVAARALQGKYQVTMLEEGKEFRPFSLPVGRLAELRRTGLFFDERLIRLLLPNMRLERSQEVVIARGIGVGGTTPLATGNAVRCDGTLKKLGIDLDAEFEALYRELPITTEHRNRWNSATRKMFEIFESMGLDPQVTPKLLNAEDCVNCGHCAIGCPADAKWDTRMLVDEAVRKGAELVTDCKVTKLLVSGNEVTGVEARHHGRKAVWKADLVVLCAGGIGTPVILENSGIPCRKTFFVDMVLCVAGELPGFRQDRQLLMPFISQQDGYILSPYMDYLSFFFKKNWRRPMGDIASIMIKLADEETGSVSRRRIDKVMTETDRRNMKRAVSQCREILAEMGIPKKEQFLGLLNAGHPGGMLPLTAAVKDTLHDPSLPDNLYVADATILPEAPGNPPMLTIMALAAKIAGML